MSEITAVSSPNAPAAIGPYSQAVRVGDTVYCSGQIALSPTTGEMVSDDLEGQTHQVFKNLTGVLEEAGTNLGRVVKTTVYLASMADFPEVNAIYADYFGEHRPARATVEASCLPKNALVEIDCIAVI